MQDEQGRPLPPYRGSEAAQVFGFLDHQRETLAWKASGLDREQLSRTLPPSTMTLGGLLKHMTFVEDWWFLHKFLGEPEREPWASVDWDSDPDWDWHTARDAEPDGLRARWRESVERAQAVTADADLDDLSATVNRRGEHFSLRWVVLHMIEEYARHCGHADLIRESIDGHVGD